MEKIPVSELKAMANKHNLTHIILFAAGERPGENPHLQFVSTYGSSVEHCDQAAQFGDKLKHALGWPEILNVMPSRVKKLSDRVHELEGILAANGIDPQKQLQGG